MSANVFWKNKLDIGKNILLGYDKFSHNEEYYSIAKGVKISNSHKYLVSHQYYNPILVASVALFVPLVSLPRREMQATNLWVLPIPYAVSQSIVFVLLDFASHPTLGLSKELGKFWEFVQCYYTVLCFCAAPTLQDKVGELSK